jgi:hypothetical protein
MHQGACGNLEQDGRLHLEYASGRRLEQAAVEGVVLRCRQAALDHGRSSPGARRPPCRQPQRAPFSAATTSRWTAVVQSR